MASPFLGSQTAWLLPKPPQPLRPHRQSCAGCAQEQRQGGVPPCSNPPADPWSGQPGAALGSLRSPGSQPCPPPTHPTTALSTPEGAPLLGSCFKALGSLHGLPSFIPCAGAPIPSRRGPLTKHTPGVNPRNGPRAGPSICTFKIPRLLSKHSLDREPLRPP